LIYGAPYEIRTRVTALRGLSHRAWPFPGIPYNLT
jgi:hypothetical protein